MSDTTHPDQHRELFAFYQAGLESGAIKPDQIIAWVDRIIAHDDEVDPFFADLALAGHDINKLLATIKELLGDGRHPTGYRVSLGDLYWRLERKEITPTEAHDRIRGYLYASSQIDDDERYRLIGSEDALSLALDRIWGSVEEAMTRLKGDLRIYSGFQLERPELWHSANSSVESALKKEQADRDERAARSAWPFLSSPLHQQRTLAGTWQMHHVHP